MIKFTKNNKCTFRIRKKILSEFIEFIVQFIVECIKILLNLSDDGLNALQLCMDRFAILFLSIPGPGPPGPGLS